MNVYEYRAFLACLIALVSVVGIAAFLAFYGKYTEALGVGAVVTGLIGIMRQPQAISEVKVSNDPAHPVPVEEN